MPSCSMVVVVSPLSLGCSSAAATSGSDSSSPHAAPSRAATAMPAPSFLYLRFISCPPLGGDVVVLGRTTRLGCALDGQSMLAFGKSAGGHGYEERSLSGDQTQLSHAAVD